MHFFLKIKEKILFKKFQRLFYNNKLDNYFIGCNFKNSIEKDIFNYYKKEEQYQFKNFNKNIFLEPLFDIYINNFVEDNTEHYKYLEKFKENFAFVYFNEYVNNINKNKVFGSLFGLVVGDALGTTLEFQPRDNSYTLTEIKGGGILNLNAGDWTDDTSMMLCIVDSFIKEHKDTKGQKAFNLKTQIDNYIKWFKEGFLSTNDRCVDIGMTVRNGLQYYQRTNTIKAGHNNIKASGNGSIMRLAPVPLYFKDNFKEAVIKSRESSETTHRSPLCLEGCAYFGAIINIALNNSEYTKDDILFSDKIQNINFSQPEIISIVDGSAWRNLTYEELPNTGYVIDTLIASLWCFYYSENFAEGLIKAVNLAGDADTIGAVYGQIAGVFYGFDTIPKRWISILSKKEILFSMFDNFYNLNNK
tara:strand:+ start:7853 stop:9100 length:1248 start_codon:yes stop_codon:yes gene_type:complete